ncbi:hypothetical protein HDU93_007844 [Gonapodya sp. JEL0774]|nr:hypothetical protein HDU93_007844 [Gonapodya sp. JEL0774]
MDRDTASQLTIALGFIDFVSKPFFDVLADFLPILDIFSQNLVDNRASWSSASHPNLSFIGSDVTEESDSAGSDQSEMNDVTGRNIEHHIEPGESVGLLPPRDSLPGSNEVLEEDMCDNDGMFERPYIGIATPPNNEVATPAQMQQIQAANRSATNEQSMMQPDYAWNQWSTSILQSLTDAVVDSTTSLQRFVGLAGGKLGGEDQQNNKSD